MTTTIRLYQGHVLDALAQIPDQSVHACMTSPPYWGLRSYLNTNDQQKHLEIGGEPTLEEYVAKLVEVFRGVKRILRDDGTFWLNLGDSYGANWNSHRDTGGGGFKVNNRERVKHPPPGIKSKDLCGIPWRTALALQSDGWWIRSDIVWSKTNCLPEPITDRPTHTHEYIFLLTKRSRYFYDHNAVREPAVGKGHYMRFWRKGDEANAVAKTRRTDGNKVYLMDGTLGANLRSVWTFPSAYSSHEGGDDGGHYAKWPQAMVDRMIQLATSTAGVCCACGMPYRRTRERVYDKKYGYVKVGIPGEGKNRGRRVGAMGDSSYQPIGWEPSCACDAGPPIPAVVLDPFVGSGTTMIISRGLGRSSIGIELNPEYCDMTTKRLHNTFPWESRVERIIIPTRETKQPTDVPGHESGNKDTVGRIPIRRPSCPTPNETQSTK